MSSRIKEEHAYYERELNSIRDTLAQAGVIGVRMSTYYRVPINKQNAEIIKTFQLLHGDWKLEEWTRHILIHAKPWVDTNGVYPMPF